MRDFDRAFPETPDYVKSAIRAGCRKGERHARNRRRVYAIASVAAVFVVLIGSVGLFLNREHSDPSRLHSTNSNVLSQGGNTSPGATGGQAAAAPTTTQGSTTASASFATVGATAAPTATVMNIDDVKELLEEVEPYDYSKTIIAEFQEADIMAIEMDTIVEVIELEETDAAIPMEPEPDDSIEEEAMDTSQSMNEASMDYAHGDMAVASMDAVDEMDVYFSTPTGVWYHTWEGCSGMVNAAMRTLYECESLGQMPCPRCTDYVDSDAIWVESNSIYYHTNFDCVEDRDVIEMGIDVAHQAGYTLCPICSLNDPVLIWEGEVWSTDVGTYYHTNEDCSNMMSAELRPVSEALLLGQKTCPVCFPEGSIVMCATSWDGVNLLMCYDVVNTIGFTLLEEELYSSNLQLSNEHEYVLYSFMGDMEVDRLSEFTNAGTMAYYNAQSVQLVVEQPYLVCRVFDDGIDGVERVLVLYETEDPEEMLFSAKIEKSGAYLDASGDIYTIESEEEATLLTMDGMSDETVESVTFTGIFDEWDSSKHFFTSGSFYNGYVDLQIEFLDGALNDYALMTVYIDSDEQLEFGVEIDFAEVLHEDGALEMRALLTVDEAEMLYNDLLGGFPFEMENEEWYG